MLDVIVTHFKLAKTELKKLILILFLLILLLLLLLLFIVVTIVFVVDLIVNIVAIFVITIVVVCKENQSCLITSDLISIKLSHHKWMLGMKCLIFTKKNCDLTMIK